MVQSDALVELRAVVVKDLHRPGGWNVAQNIQNHTGISTLEPLGRVIHEHYHSPSRRFLCARVHKQL